MHYIHGVKRKRVHGAEIVFSNHFLDKVRFPGNSSFSKSSRVCIFLLFSVDLVFFSAFGVFYTMIICSGKDPNGNTPKAIFPLDLKRGRFLPGPWVM